MTTILTFTIGENNSYKGNKENDDYENEITPQQRR